MRVKAILCLGVLAAAPGAQALWGGKGTDVVQLTLHKELKEVPTARTHLRFHTVTPPPQLKASPFLWAVALYRDGCGYCELLKCAPPAPPRLAKLTPPSRPEWEKLGTRVRKMAHVAAVDVTTHAHIAQSLQEEYNFKVRRPRRSDGRCFDVGRRSRGFPRW